MIATHGTDQVTYLSPFGKHQYDLQLSSCLIFDVLYPAQGFIDPHIHMIKGGLSLVLPDIASCKSVAELKSVISQACSKCSLCWYSTELMNPICSADLILSACDWLKAWVGNQEDISE